MQVRAKVRLFDGISIREEGEVFEFNGIVNKNMEPLEPLEQPEAPKKAAKPKKDDAFE